MATQAEELGDFKSFLVELTEVVEYAARALNLAAEELMRMRLDMGKVSDHVLVERLLLRMLTPNPPVEYFGLPLRTRFL